VVPLHLEEPFATKETGRELWRRKSGALGVARPQLGETTLRVRLTPHYKFIYGYADTDENECEPRSPFQSFELYQYGWPSGDSFIGFEYGRVYHVLDGPPTVRSMVCTNNFRSDMEGCPTTVVLIRCSGNRLTSLDHKWSAAVQLLEATKNPLSRVHQPTTHAIREVFTDHETSIRK
jgi:hypothetical protein